MLLPGTGPLLLKTEDLIVSFIEASEEVYFKHENLTGGTTGLVFAFFNGLAIIKCYCSLYYLPCIGIVFRFLEDKDFVIFVDSYLLD